MNRPTVRLGVEGLLENSVALPTPWDSLSSVGLVTSDGSQARSPRAHPGDQQKALSPTRLLLLEAGVPLTKLFSPEHGVSAGAPDGRPVEDGIDQLTHLPVVSLYGPRLRPREEDLKDLDLVLFDLQDVGVRFYTYLWTLTLVMEACQNAGTPLWVLDRPNPLGGLPEWVEGPFPDPDYPPDFLSRWSIPIRHSLTLGEMALLLREEMGIDVDLHVVPVQGWQRDWLWPETEIPFLPPSPGIPNFTSALLYPGLALLEATNVDEGRGTPLSFRRFGASWMDGEAAARHLNERGLPGISPQAVVLPGTAGPSEGVAIQVSDPREVRPVFLGLNLLALLAGTQRNGFGWRPYPTAANPAGQDHLFRLLGSRDTVRRLELEAALLTPAEISEITRAPGWWERAEPHLLYS